jgi:hypothetical protein
MNFLKRITQSNFYTKLTHWEYWPFGILQFPVFFYYGWLSLRSRSFLFFTASNPGIEMGGMFGESKFQILQRIPSHLIPKTIVVEATSTPQKVIGIIRQHGYNFPVIFKPDLGERGFMVKRIDNENEVGDYLKKIRVRFLVQELVDLPMEFGVLYERLPSAQHGRVTSIVMKEMLSVTGDGKSTLRELIFGKPRAKLQWENLKEAYGDRLNEVVEKDKAIELVSIGNHARGTKFLNGNNLITLKLCESFDAIGKHIEGFYFGRFDVRCSTLEDLESGNVKILELNGCGAEPAHIYDPDFKIIDAMGVLFRHWRSIFDISRENRSLGISFTPFREARMFYKRFKDATR